jgi:hypothetical protein
MLKNLLDKAKSIKDSAVNNFSSVVDDRIKVLEEQVKTLSINNLALNEALGKMYAELILTRQQGVNILTAIVLAHGGELKITSEFLEILKDENNTVALNMNQLEDGGIELKVEQAGEMPEDDKQ